MKKIGYVGIVVILMGVITGCGTTGKFVYPSQMSSLVRFDSSTVSDKTVVVLPFDDYRNDENSCMFGMYLIPLMPMGWGTYDRPDAASMFLSIVAYDTTPTEDLAKATATSFRHSLLFKDAFFTLGGEQDKADFVVHGRLKEMKYHGKMFTYGLSVYGPILWVFGAPAGMSENRIVVELDMRDKSGKKVWEWAMSDEDWIVQWIYCRMGYDVKMFTRMYQNGMNHALEDLAKQIKAHPDQFK